MREGPVVAIVPMKGHSSRVPHKNIRPLQGRPLFHWIVEALLAAPTVDRVVVESDSSRILDATAAAFPSVSLLRRPAELEGDDVPMNALIEFHMSQLDGAVYLQTHSTNPLLRAETIERAIGVYRASAEHDSLFGVTALRTRLFWADGSPANHDPDALIPTQDLPPVYEENSNIYLFTPDSFARRGHRIGTSPRMFEIEALEAVDIDDPADFAFADYLMGLRLSGRPALVPFDPGATPGSAP